jgi:coproporphyrinogen III oxidase-like Fe-S oxidoreductase
VNGDGGRGGPVPHLYVHVPFCRKHCPYCDQAVTAHDPPDLEGWLAAVGSELALREAEGSARPGPSRPFWSGAARRPPWDPR